MTNVVYVAYCLVAEDDMEVTVQVGQKGLSFASNAPLRKDDDTIILPKGLLLSAAGRDLVGKPLQPTNTNTANTKVRVIVNIYPTFMVIMQSSSYYGW